MWYFTLLLLVGAVVAQSQHEHAWKTGNQYQYIVQSRTLSTLDSINDQCSGILIRAMLTLQAVSSDKLQALLTMPQFARIHAKLQDGLDTQMSDQELQYQELPLSGKPFQITLKHGMIRDLLVPKDMPTWELNLLKGIVSQLQVDTQGENTIYDRSTQEPREGQYYASYKTMEDTVGGKCEVLYDISPLHADDQYNSPELAPLLREHNNEDVHLIDIRKTKNYNNCNQQRGYHVGLSGKMSLTRDSDNDRMITRASDSRIVISGNLKQFTIQSAVTTNNIFVKSEQQDTFLGTVYSKINLTLAKLDKITKELSINHNNLVSTGNLLYTYNNPLTEIEQGRNYQETISRNSQQIQSSESSSGEHHQSQGKRHSGSSSSATSSSEEFQHLQTLPNLNEAPRSMTPLGIVFQNDPSMNVVQEAQKQMTQIVADLQQSNNMPHEEMLERFTNFVKLLRLMNTNQIAQLEQEIRGKVPNNLQSDEDQAVEKNDYWNVYRDGVAQAGTGPALITIVKLVHNGKLQGREAARVISKIPKVVRIPSELYIEEVFNNLVANQKVQQQEFLNKVAPVAFSELVRNAQVNKRHSQNSYPIYYFGKVNPVNDKTVTENYISYMEKQLQKCIQNGDNAQAQAFIVALGNFGHSKVIKVFEPFLEGQQKSTTYQRTLMVLSLRTLVRHSPEKIAPVLYKIYLNEKESHEVRCAAVHLYMLTNPSSISLMRMARYTNYDNNQQVNAAVKSSIIALSKLNKPGFYRLAQKARQARKLLTTKKFPSTSSRGVYTENTIMHIISSDDSSVPKNVYWNAQTIFGNLAKSVFELEYGVSSVKQLLEIFEKPEAHHENAWLDNLRQSLGMQATTLEPEEGHFRFSSIYGTDFYTFDQQSVEKFASLVKMNLKKNQLLHLNYINSYDELVSLPTESGLAFTASIEVPTLTRVYVSKRNVQGHKANNDAFNGVVNVLVANKVQTRFGFLLSHENEHLIAGVDRNAFAHIPIEYNLNTELEEPLQNYEMRMHVDPEEHNSRLKLAHVSVIPFTARVNLKDCQPVSRNHMLRVLDTKDQTKSSVRIGAIHISSESDEELSLENIFQWFPSFFSNSISYRKAEVFDMRRGSDEADETKINVFYDEFISDNNNKEHEEPMHDSVPDITDKQPNSETRRKQFLEEVCKGFKSAVQTRLIDIAVEIPFLQSRQILTIAVGESNVERKKQYLAYWNVQTKTGEVIYEAAVSGTVHSTQDNFLSYDKAAQQVPQDEFTFNVRIGRNYKRAEKIQLQGRLLQSNSLTETLMKLNIVKECINDMQTNKGLQACQKAIEIALKKNLFQMTIKTESDKYHGIANRILFYLSETLTNANIEHLQNPDLQNQIYVEVKTSPNFENTETTLQTSQMNLKFKMIDPYEEKLWQEDEHEDFENEEEQALCTVSKNEVVTFDQKSYPLNMGAIWHVLMIPEQQQRQNNPNTKPTSDNMKVSVMARKVNNRIQVRVMLGEKKYQLQQSDDHLQVLINGQEVKLSKQNSLQDQENGKIVSELFIQPDGTLMLDSKKYGINVLYDGKQVRLQVTKNYRNAIRGLCGNYDNQATNDFLTPQNCVLLKPEEFTATYALLNTEVEDNNAQKITIAKNKEKANRATCYKTTPVQTNVISDREAGRVLERLTWGYHQNTNQNKKNRENVQFMYRTKIDEDDQEVCFSVRPVPTCPMNSKAAETKKKNVAMHCMPRNDAAEELKRRIQQGANPDLSHKTVSKKQVVEVPTACITLH